jgi:predicted HD phosphohydrolase
LHGLSRIGLSECLGKRHGRATTFLGNFALNPAAILSLYASLGEKQYAGEPVNQIEHAWQCGQHAANARAGEALQLAAWLHDVGHLIANVPGSPTVHGIDDRHEHVGADALEKIWGAAVAEPVRLHVLAKRFLVTTRRDYREKLSDDSKRSLELQGGLMSDDEVKAFEASPYSEQAVWIRVWDDLGKTATPKDPQTPDRQLALLGALMQSVTVRATGATLPDPGATSDTQAPIDIRQ